MAHTGWDSLTLDLQHGLLDYALAVPMIQAISTTSVVPFARVPWNDPAIIMKMLDAGCTGIICPMINSRSDAERLAAACRYPPRGYRSFGPTRAALTVGGEHVKQANDRVITLAMVETAAALACIDEIASVRGLDGIFIGPNDLSQDLFGSTERDLSAPELLEAIDMVLAAARRHDLVTGIFASSLESAVAMSRRGVQFVTVLSDARLLSSAARAVTQAFRAAVPR